MKQGSSQEGGRLGDVLLQSRNDEGGAKGLSGLRDGIERVTYLIRAERP